MFMAMPWAVIGGMIAYRKSWFDEVGATKFPDTWEEYREVGKKLKAKGRPIGQTLGHTFGDAPAFTYPYLWSWGGKEVEADGKTVAINTKETIESVKFMTGFWKDAHDEGGARLGRHQQQPRVPVADHLGDAERRLDLHRDRCASPTSTRPRRATPMKNDILHAPLPRARPGSSASTCCSRHADEVLEEPEGGEGLPEVDPHREELREVVRLAEGLRHAAHGQVGRAQAVGRGSGDGAVQGRGQARPGAGLRRPAEPEGGRGAVKYIITDMYAKAVQGMPAEEAVKWAEGELKKIYTA